MGEFVKEIQGLTAKDMSAAVNKLLKTPPSLAVSGGWAGLGGCVVWAPGRENMLGCLGCSLSQTHIVVFALSPCRPAQPRAPLCHPHPIPIPDLHAPTILPFLTHRCWATSPTCRAMTRWPSALREQA